MKVTRCDNAQCGLVQFSENMVLLVSYQTVIGWANRSTKHITLTAERYSPTTQQQLSRKLLRRPEFAGFTCFRLEHAPFVARARAFGLSVYENPKSGAHVVSPHNFTR